MFNTAVPFKGVVLVDPEGKEGNRIKICRNQIYGYKLFYF